MSLRVLLATSTLDDRAGTELYTRDLAIELLRQGHLPDVYASRLGCVSDELAAAGIPVTDSLRELDFEPDIIHGHHYYETCAAIRRCPHTPAVFVCHDHSHWKAAPPIHSRIVRYYGVSELCLARLRKSSVEESRIVRLYNFVDTRRYLPRPALPSVPRRALVLSNYARADNYLPAIAEACRREELELDVIGLGVGNPVADPAEVLPKYDLVFAKAKSAMEAMAVGAAVVLCDFGGVGPMVTPRNFAELRPLNFGFQALTDPHSPEILVRRIQDYDAADAARVQDLIRSCAGLEKATEELLAEYHEVIAEYRSCSATGGRMRDLRCYALMPKHVLTEGATSFWRSLPPETRTMLKRYRSLGPLKTLARRALRG